MRPVQSPAPGAPGSFAPTWTPEPPQPRRAPEPERHSAPQPQPSYPSEVARPAYDDIVERSSRAGLSRGPQEPRPFEPEAPEPELDPFAADELKRYLAADAEEHGQPFGDRSYRAEPAVFEEEEDASFPSEDQFEPEPEPQLFASEQQLFASEQETGPAAYDAEFSAYGDLEDEEEQTPSYGDAFGRDAQDFVRASEELDEAFGRQPEDLDAGVGAGSRQVQPFEARYDQHPEIALGVYPQQEGDASFEQSFFADEQGDAELDAGAPAAGRKGRKRLMIAASLVGALAIGGGLAYVYKDDGASVAGSGQPPLITADQRPVKTTPTEPGGKTFPHKNKLIYDRLQGEEPAERERLVSRQEDVAAVGSSSSGPAAQPSAGGRQVAVATQTATDAETSSTSSEQAAASRRVRTFVVLPDGSVVKPDDAASQGAAAAPAPQPEAPEQPASIPGLTVTLPGSRSAAAPRTATASQAQVAAQQPAAQPERQQLAAVQSQSDTASVAAPVRKPAPPSAQQAPTQQAPAQQAPAQQAAVQPAKPAPQAAAAESSGAFVVQVAARKSQTDALAAFADLQQRYPQLLSGYRPIIERADLGAKGVWYRLRVGPMETKTVAANLCGKLQAAGMKECLIYPQ